MGCYSGYSLIIDSELPLPELPEVEGEPDVVIRLGHVPRTARVASLREELAINRLVGAFRISDGREVVCDPVADADPGALQALLLGRMMAYLLRQRGWLPLHASGVILNGAGVLFLGVSGCGKSTLAAAFHARGHTAMIDDVGAVRVHDRQCTVLPARSKLRLSEHSLSMLPRAEAVPQWDKYLVDVTRGTLPRDVVVKRIYVLEDGNNIAATAIPATASVRFLSAHSFFKRRRMDEASLRNHLRDCTAVAGAACIRKLTRPRCLSALPDVVRFIERESEG